MCKERPETGGVFIFDLKTIHFFKDILADNTYAENRKIQRLYGTIIMMRRVLIMSMSLPYS